MSEDDDALFKAAMGHLERRPEDSPEDEALFVRSIATLEMSPEARVEAPARPKPLGKPRDVAKSIRRGTLRTDITLDLHGLTEAQAWEALVRCLESSRAAEHEVVLVICGRGLHSKGRAVLQEALQRWLRGPLNKHVRASHPASVGPGGRGAWFLMLRRG